MADKKITALTASTALSTDDLFHVVDSPASSPSNKKITATNVFTKIPTYIGHSGTPQTLTGAGAINSSTAITLLVTTGSNALTIADGAVDGQVKYIVMKTDGGDGTLTGANLVGASITFADAGDAVSLIWTDSKWYAMQASGGPVYAAT